MKRLWPLLPVAFLLYACSEKMDPEEVEDAEVTDVMLSGSGFLGIVAGAIAIPNFMAMQYRAKRSEVQSNMKAIKTAQEAYYAEFGRYLTVANFNPNDRPGKELRDFGSGTAFDTIGWKPDGQVRGSYKVQTLSTTDFMVYAITDVDGDSQKASFTCTKTINVTMNTPNDVY